MKTNAKTFIGFATAGLLILIAVGFSLVRSSRFVDDTQWTVHSVRVRGELERMTTLLATAQNNLRTFHFTGQQYYRDLYQKALAELNASREHIKNMTRDNPTQQAQLQKVNELLDEKIKLWADSFALYQKIGAAGFRERLRGDEGKQFDLTLLTAIEALKTEEDRLFTTRTDQALLQGARTKIVVGTGGLLAFVLLMTGSVVVFIDRRRRNQAEADIDRFFTLSLDLLCISGMDGYFKRLSPSYQDVLGYSLEELYSRPILDFVLPEDIEPTNKQIARQMFGEKVLSFENRYVCKDGSLRTLSWKSVPVGDFMYAVARDVTLQKQFESDLLSARKSAEQTSDAKSAFLANMSHEIRTPLNGVIGMTRLMAQTELNERQKGYLDTIKTQGHALLAIINEVLDLSKIESHKLQLEDAHFELESLLAGTISIVEEAAKAKGLSITADIADGVPEFLMGDSLRLRQVLLNLLNNAIKFSEQGRITIRVSNKSVGNSDARLLFEITDQGIGLDPESRKKLFEPFTQGDESTSRKYGGTGLGLAISRQIVELMGGKIDVESIPGTGSRFFFDVNLKVAKYGENANPLDPGLTETRLNGYILIVEDNRANQRVAGEMVLALGCRHKIVSNGVEAIEALLAENFDLVLMDGQMPVMDGYQATREIRSGKAGDRNRMIGIVATTANAIQGDLEKCLEVGMNDYVGKPISFEDLTFKVEKWLTRGRNIIDIAAIERLKQIRHREKTNLARSLIEIFIADTPGAILEMRSALDAGDTAKVSSAAHALKSNCASIGAMRLRDLFERLEHHGGRLNMQQFAVLVSLVERESKLAIDALKEIQARL